MLASFYWEKVTNKAFTTSVLVALAVFLPVRFGWIPVDGAFGIVVDVLAVLGIGVVLGLMVFGFLGARAAKTVGVLAVLVSAPFAIGSLHEYATLCGSLVAYSVSTVICWAMSVRQEEGFDFSVIAERTGNFDDGGAAATADGQGGTPSPAGPSAPEAPRTRATSSPPHTPSETRGGTVTVALSVYVLMWPVAVAVILFVISRGFFREWLEARRNGQEMI